MASKRCHHRHIIHALCDPSSSSCYSWQAVDGLLLRLVINGVTANWSVQCQKEMAGFLALALPVELDLLFLVG